MMTRLNKLGVCMSTSRKVPILDECREQTNRNIVQALQHNPLVKITGDNLNMTVKRSQETSTQGHEKLDCFTSNMIFSRVATHTRDISNNPPMINEKNITPDKFVPSKEEKETAIDTYAIIIARIWHKRFPELKWMKAVLPKHIPHRHTEEMCQKSTVMPLRLMFKNESKYEDCISIMDVYVEDLTRLFTAAFGELPTSSANTSYN
mgnify:CR=1 FL=1